MSTLDLSREPLLTLNKDGISDELFKLLWSKDEMNYSPMIHIPDTIVYKYGQPIAWYFTANNGHVKKKNRFNLVSSKIEDAFNRHPLGYDVIAYFITMPNEYELTHSHQQQQQATNNNNSNNNNNNTIVPTTPTIIEYFDRDQLNKFLYNNKKDVNGILQKFIEPKTTQNEVIRVIWSPKLILLERAENIHHLHDKRYGLYEKCVLYEGPDYYYKTSPLRGPVLSGQIQRTVENAIAHINEVTFGQKQISRIVLTFKIDSQEKLWLLYSTSIRCLDMMDLKPLGADNPNITGSLSNVRNLLNIDKVLSLSEKVTLNPLKSYNFTSETRLPAKVRISCISCKTETIEELRHPITYKSIIKHYDHVLQLLQSSISLRHHNRKEGTIAWPPDREIVDAAGGVGFCGLLLDKLDPSTANNSTNNNEKELKSLKEDYRLRRRTDNIRYKAIKDVQIPPIIIALHPKLSSETYERCKNDPLFFNKTVHVCESCYLVYAEFTTMLLDLGENIHKLLAPDGIVPNTLRSNSAKTAAGTRGGGGGGIDGHRPTSADWRAISQSANTSQQGGGRGMSGGMYQSSSILSSSLSDTALQHHIEARQRSIGLRTDDQRPAPLLPSTVRTANETAAFGYPSHQEGSAIISPNTSIYHSGGILEADSHSLLSPSHAVGGGAGGIPGTVAPRTFQYNPEEVQSMIADRERKFFKEISLNPQLKDSHPLQHLISTQQKLKLIDEQSGILMSNKAKSGLAPSLFGDTQYGKQIKSQQTHSKWPAYEVEIPYTINGEIVLPSELKKRKTETIKLKKLQKQRTLQSFLAGEMAEARAESEKDNTLLQSNTTPDLIKVLKVVEEHTKVNSLPPMKEKKNDNNNADPIDQNIKNSAQYRSFLSESLKRIEDDVAELALQPQSRSDGKGKHTRGTSSAGGIGFGGSITQSSTGKRSNNSDSYTPLSSTTNQQDTPLNTAGTTASNTTPMSKSVSTSAPSTNNKNKRKDSNSENGKPVAGSSKKQGIEAKGSKESAERGAKGSVTVAVATAPAAEKTENPIKETTVSNPSTTEPIAKGLLEEITNEEEKERKQEESKNDSLIQDDLSFSPYSNHSSKDHSREVMSGIPPPHLPLQGEEREDYGLSNNSESQFSGAVESSSPPLPSSAERVQEDSLESSSHDVAMHYTAHLIDHAVRSVSREGSRPASSTQVKQSILFPLEKEEEDIEEEKDYNNSNNTDLLEAISDSIMKEALEESDYANQQQPLDENEE